MSKLRAGQSNVALLHDAQTDAARVQFLGQRFQFNDVVLRFVPGAVKQLAQETARATEDISRRVLAIQQDADEAGRSIDGISDVIGQITEFQTTIAAAVEEQTRTTRRSASELAQMGAELSRVVAQFSH